ncbi:TetR/AcrR family transcriptional regulator [Leptolyngbyaceae cyanobacterium CCMR0082]|uniref:TetR/AcrR family transcriptional regulator n=1 Tax=Adonisia turfae CCMR0082 TaxID=2304604 RepID=A0A6M0S0B1_9CYAN|nr:TetR/AcrR family transcriptional regulator [Adonisia turfae]NEZ61670.1 TetR/AcrR family transcriptional regulator [Adonisia turfae CCMR0082]
MKKSPGRPRKFNEEEVLQHAAKVFLNEGFEASSYESISEAMGLSKPSLYNAFGDKQALFTRVVAEYSLQAHEYIVKEFSGAGTLQAACQKMLLAAAKFYSTPDGPSVGCLLVGTALPASSQYDEIRDTLRDFTKRMETSIEKIINAEYSKDAAALDQHPKNIARHISSLLFALAVRARMGLSRKKLNQIALELAEFI